MPREPADEISRLTGVRTGKNSYYPAFVRSSTRMQRTVRAMDRISSVVVRTVEGPRGVLEEVVRAAAGHLEAPWGLLALGDDQLRGARPRFVVVGPGGRSPDDAARLPAYVMAELTAIRAGERAFGAVSTGWLRSPMNLEGRQIGVLSVRPGLGEDPEPEDLAVLRILANQASVSLHTSEQYQAGVTLHRRAQRLNRAAELQARDLAVRTAELQAAEKQLVAATQREIVGSERHRIARELHDSVTQYVLSAGMAVEVARGDAVDRSLDSMAEQLSRAKVFTQTAVEQLRTAIYALDQPPEEAAASLEELIGLVVAHHRPALDVRVVAEGAVSEIPAAASQDLARSVGESLFNVAAHARATRVNVRLRYRPEALTVSVSDDGSGDPTTLRRMLRLEQRSVGDGRHRGLVNMDDRLRSIGGTLAFRRSRLGGVRIVLRVPLPVQTRATSSAGAP
ncbi:MadS family sensor histidine kinase [Flexivirga caeni]|uniref:MadS family sensor histidine kinase n=1 Tax=Flexivirga caeni TaxID=2294115 RepID=UPI001FE7A37C|nr:histidine kinase [Flexivirga caeni]